MNKFLLAIYRNDDYTLEVHINRRNYSDHHDITEALKVLIGDTDLELYKRIKYAQTLLLAGKWTDGPCNVVLMGFSTIKKCGSLFTSKLRMQLSRSTQTGILKDLTCL